MPLDIVYYPHPALRHRSKPLKKVDAELRKLIAEMFELMYRHEGVGLAANQVDLPYRLFVTNPEGDRAVKEAEFAFINPVIHSGKGQTEADEGCLSIPDIYAPVTRKETVRIQAYDVSGKEVDAPLEGFFARVVQHEVDHLDGVLFIDRLSPAAAADVKETLDEFELDYRSKRETGEIPSDEQVAARLAQLEALRT